MTAEELSLLPIDPNHPDQMRKLQALFEGAPEYLRCIHGGPPSPREAEDTVTALPPGMGYEDKFVLGIYRDQELLGCIDLIRGYPNRQTAMLGLLLLPESKQGTGLGRLAFEMAQAFILKWAGVNTIRIGIVGTNSKVIPFWTKMGFVDTGEKHPYQNGAIKSDTLIFEKQITPQ